MPTPLPISPLRAMARRLLVPLGVAALLLVACGFAYWHVEPTTPRLADALWLAFATASTIGYGDIVPSTPASRLLSVAVLLLGFGVLSLVTAAVATIWVESQERVIEREILHDLHAQVRELRRELAELRPRAASADAATAPAGATAARAGRRRSAYRPARNRAR